MLVYKYDNRDLINLQGGIFSIYGLAPLFIYMKMNIESEMRALGHRQYVRVESMLLGMILP